MAYGGRYVPETLIPALDELDGGLGGRAAPTTRFRAELHELRTNYAGPPDAADARRALRPRTSAST